MNMGEISANQNKMEYTTKKEPAEMYEKMITEVVADLKVADLKVERNTEVVRGIIHAAGASFGGVITYQVLLKPSIGWAIAGGVITALWAFRSYTHFRNAYKHNKKAKGLEKEIAELEKE